MGEDDFIAEDEILRLTGWSPKTLANIRCMDHKFPKPCKGKIRRYLRREFFNWYTDRGRAA